MYIYIGAEEQIRRKEKLKEYRKNKRQFPYASARLKSKCATLKFAETNVFILDPFLIHFFIFFSRLIFRAFPFNWVHEETSQTHAAAARFSLLLCFPTS